METRTHKYGFAMLAGGAGRRIGKVNKATLKLGDITFAGKISKEIDSCSMPCYLSSAVYEQNVPDGWTEVPDAVTDEEGDYIGPMGGIYSCLLRAAEDGLEGLVFCPCDAPLYSAGAAEELLRLVGAANDKGRDPDGIVLRTGDGRFQMTFGFYSISLIPTLEKLIRAGDYRLLSYVDTADIQVVDTNDTGIDDKVFLNINSMEDYRSLKR